MQITSVNVGRPRRLDGRSFRGETGIFKEAVSEPVEISPLGLVSDAVLNEKYHGGPDQAVYVYRQEDYDWWSDTLDRQIPPGAFGDNLTLAGLPSPELTVGSRLQFAEVELEVTAPRIPCNTLAERMGDAGFAKQFVKAERPGVYCRVLAAGRVQEGERFSFTPGEPDGVTTLDMFRGAYRKLDEATLTRFLAAPIDVRSRTEYERQLAGLKG